MKKRLIVLGIFLFVIMSVFISAKNSEDILKIDPKIEEALQDQNDVFVFIKMKTKDSKWDTLEKPQKNLEDTKYIKEQRGWNTITEICSNLQ